MKLAVVGATGMVGKEILEVISERDLPIKEVFLVSSEKSGRNAPRFPGLVGRSDFSGIFTLPQKFVSSGQA